MRVRAYEDRAKRFGMVQVLLGESAKGALALASAEIKVYAKGGASTLF